MWDICTALDVTNVYFVVGTSCSDMEESEPGLNSQANQLAKEIDEVQNDDVKKHFLRRVRPFIKFA